MSGTRVATVEASASDAEVTRVLGIVKPATVITSKALRPRLPVSLLCDPTIILIDDMPMGAAGEPVNDGASKPAPLSFLPAPDEEGASVAKESRDEGALCVLTSGTTSLSKIVILRHDALSCATNYMCEDVERNRGDRVGLFWVYYYMLSAIGLGATVFVLPDTTFFNPTALVSSVRENRLTGLYLTPSILTSCLQVISEAQLATDLATLRVIWLTGERVTSKMRARLNRVLPWVRVRNVYSTNESGDNAIADSDDTFTMIEGTEFEVLDPVTLLPVPDGEVGALHVRCPWLFLGYWTVEGLSYAADANERFRTGDLVRCLGGRTISFESRESASHIKVRGFKVFPELIEAELIKHPAVDAAWITAVGEDGDDTSSRLEAAVDLSDHALSSVSARTLRAYMAERVPAYMVPVAFRSLAPARGGTRTTSVEGDSGADRIMSPVFQRCIAQSGKRPSQKDLASLIAGLPDLGDVTSGEATGKTGDEDGALAPMEAKVARVWSLVLSLPLSSFTADASFFDFGGSLTFFKLAKELGAEFNVELGVAELLQVPTLTAMTGLISSSLASSTALDSSSSSGGGGASSADKDSDVDGGAQHPAVATKAKSFDPVAEARKFPISPPLKGAARLPTPEVAAAVSAATLLRYRAVPTKTVLVTGCTGYVGAFLMKTLASRADVACVVCLVRAADAEAALKRLRATCVKRAIDDDDFEAWFAKVSALPGDVASPRLGLSGSEYAQLACSVHSIVHAAAEVNMLKPAQSLSHTNVGGTSNVLSLAAMAGLPVVFTSTILPLEGAAPTGYRQSKAAAEALLIDAQHGYGVPSAVLQLGDIGIGASASPKALPDDDYVVLCLRACLALGKFPMAHGWSVSIMPVHQCADLLATLCLEAPTERFTGEPREVKGDLIRWNTLYEWMSPALPGLEAVSFDEWKRVIVELSSRDDTSERIDVSDAPSSDVPDDEAYYSPAAIASAKRMAMLLPAMEQEFSAEERRRVNGEGADCELYIDAAWGARFGAALAAA